MAWFVLSLNARLSEFVGEVRLEPVRKFELRFTVDLDFGASTGVSALYARESRDGEDGAFAVCGDLGAVGDFGERITYRAGFDGERDRVRRSSRMAAKPSRWELWA